jgi:propionyl-CoA carboxylase beta chain
VLLLLHTVVKTVTNETVTKEDLGGASVHTVKSGVAHGSFANDVVTLRAMRKLLDLLPQSNDKSTLPEKKATDSPNRLCPAVDRLVPYDSNTPYDMRDVIRQIVDHGEMFEIMPAYAQNIVTAFCRMEGHTVGVVGNVRWDKRATVAMVDFAVVLHMTYTDFFMPATEPSHVGRLS